MSILRTDKQVALNDLLVAGKESVDLYRDAAEFIEDKRIITVLTDIAEQREPHLKQFENLIRSLDDLPSEPDADKETYTSLLNHLRASLAGNTAAKTLQQRIEAETQLLELVQHARDAGLDESYDELLNGFVKQVTQAREQLQRLCDEATE